MFRVACGLRERCGWELSPSEFWSMSPAEWWLIYDINVGDNINQQQENADRIKSLYKTIKAKEKLKADSSIDKNKSACGDANKSKNLNPKEAVK